MSARASALPASLHRFAPLFSLAVFAIAMFVLHDELKKIHYRQVAAAVHQVPVTEVVLALALVVLGYFVLTFYDLLALRAQGLSIPYRKLGVASFIGYSFSNTVGHALFTSAPIRFRLYSSWGLSAEQITKLVGFCIATYWVGFVALAGGVFSFWPGVVPAALKLPFGTHRVLGVLFLLLAVGYLVASALFRRPLRIRGWEFGLPRFSVSLGQLVIGVVDLVAAAGVLYVLLPQVHGLAFPGFVGAVLVAQLAGLASMVPGGLGVFDTLMVVFLGSLIPAPEVVGALLLYRVFYFFLPFLTASVLLGVLELRRQRWAVAAAGRTAWRWLPELLPQVLALLTFVGGLVLLFSGATPAVWGRLVRLGRVVPLPVIEVSHFMGSLAGLMLLVLARGIQRRLDAAYQLTVLVLAGGIGLSLLKGLDYEEAALLLLLLALILPCRPCFQRKSSLFEQRFSPGWVAAIAVAALSTGWLVFFSYRQARIASEMWWQFALHGEAPRALRALIGILVLGLFLAAVRLMRPAPPSPRMPGRAELDEVGRLAAAAPRTSAYLALLGDKTFLFNSGRTAFLMYAAEGRSWVSFGEPVGPEAEARELIWAFLDLAEGHGGWPVFYQVTQETLHHFADAGLSLLKIGEEARAPLLGFNLEGKKRKDLRHEINHLEKTGCHFAVLPADEVEAHLPALQAVSDAWLKEKNTREKGFSLGFFDRDYLCRLPVAVVRLEDQIIAFANVLPGGEREELSVDLVRYVPEAPPGVMDFLIVGLMRWGAAEGYRWFSLGMAPLAGLDDRPGASLWNKLGGLVYRHAEHFYNFQGLRQYKEKFEPQWEPRYLASPGGFALPTILTNLATLIAGGAKGVVGK